MPTRQPSAGFRLLEHTADIGIEAWGPQLGDLFEQAALGLKSLLIGTSPVAEAQTSPVRLDADDPGELLVAWLNEIIFLFETQNLVPGSFRIEQVDRTGLQALVCNEAFAPDRHTVERQVKAATYHQLYLGKEADGWHARIYLDL